MLHWINWLLHRQVKLILDPFPSKYRIFRQLKKQLPPFSVCHRFVNNYIPPPFHITTSGNLRRRGYGCVESGKKNFNTPPPLFSPNDKQYSTYMLLIYYLHPSFHLCLSVTSSYHTCEHVDPPPLHHSLFVWLFSFHLWHAHDTKHWYRWWISQNKQIVNGNSCFQFSKEWMVVPIDI